MATAAFQSFLPSILPFRIPRSLERVFGRVFGIDEIARVYDKTQDTRHAKSIADGLLDFLEISYTTSGATPWLAGPGRPLWSATRSGTQKLAGTLVEAWVKTGAACPQ